MNYWPILRRLARRTDALVVIDGRYALQSTGMLVPAEVVRALKARRYIEPTHLGTYLLTEAGRKAVA